MSKKENQSFLEYNNIVAFHPGYYLKDILDDVGMSQEELAKRLDTSGKTVSLLINGKTDLTAEMAMKICMVFGTSFDLWMKLQQSFTEKKLEIEHLKSLEQQKKVADQMDYQYWVNLGETAENNDYAERVRFFQTYLKVANLEALANRNFLIPFEGDVDTGDVINANAWTQTAFNFAQQIETEPYSKRNLKSAIPQLKSLVDNGEGETLEEIRKILLTCGIAMVFLPHLTHNKVKSAVKWMGADKAVFVMEIRPKLDEEFWRVFFHGLFHVMQKRLTVLIADGDELKLSYAPKIEKLHQDADDFVRDFMLSTKFGQINVERL